MMVNWGQNLSPPAGSARPAVGGRPPGRGIASGFMTHDDFHLLVVWCGVLWMGPARPFPRVGSAFASARFSPPPAVRGPGSAGTGTTGGTMSAIPRTMAKTRGVPVRRCAPAQMATLTSSTAGTTAQMRFRRHRRGALRTALAPNARPRPSGAASPAPAPTRPPAWGPSPWARTAGGPAPQCPSGTVLSNGGSHPRCRQNDGCTGPPAVITSRRSALEKAT